MGPLITREHRDKVASYVDVAATDGASVVVDGRGDEVDGEADGFWMGPTLLDKVPTTSTAYTDEIFGPVLSVVRVSGYAEGIELINSGPYGNGSAIFTNDGGAARRFQREVEAGMVGINVPIPVPVAYHSFGGWKASLFGDAKAYGPHGVDFFTREKADHPALARPVARWPQPRVPAAHLSPSAGTRRRFVERRRRRHVHDCASGCWLLSVALAASATSRRRSTRRAPTPRSAQEPAGRQLVGDVPAEDGVAGGREVRARRAGRRATTPLASMNATSYSSHSSASVESTRLDEARPATVPRRARPPRRCGPRGRRATTGSRRGCRRPAGRSRSGRRRRRPGRHRGRRRCGWRRRGRRSGSRAGRSPSRRSRRP